MSLRKHSSDAENGDNRVYENGVCAVEECNAPLAALVFPWAASIVDGINEYWYDRDEQE